MTLALGPEVALPAALLAGAAAGIYTSITGAM